VNLQTLSSFLIELSENQECIFIKGNHDAWCEDWLAMEKAPDIWLSNGGRSTVESYKDYSQEKNLHLEFFQKMKNYHVDDQNRLFIHAGYSSMHGPGKEVYSSNYRWDRTFGKQPLPWIKNWRKTQHYILKGCFYITKYSSVILHTDIGIPTPVHKANVWNMDTGAAYTGALSVMDINTNEFWQSDPLPFLYPNEKGRN
jgi:serine/threonine protein phosphatase 1